MHTRGPPADPMSSIRLAFAAMRPRLPFRTRLLSALTIALVAGCAAPAEPSRPASDVATSAPSPTTAPSVSVAPASGSPEPPGAIGEPPRLGLEPVVDGLESPLDIAWRADDPSTLFVVEQG